ncbi:hypothetical protein [Saccharomonospora sp.]|uniref:hypothetical protein n=1 Tax=Saccharomonospora sp. TaxID=33913 RepID=UPI002639719D|nr:hypothetical protein [Saccharomonospora sp.]
MIDARLRALEYDAAPGADAQRARRDAMEVEHWEALRRGRYVRLWTVYLDVWAAALDACDAAYRLVRYVRQPHHRVGDLPILRSTGVPELCGTADNGVGGSVGEGAGEGAGDVVATYPCDALAYRRDRTPFGALERVHVATYVRALAAARDRLLGSSTMCSPGPRGADGHGAPPGAADSALRLWRVRHRVLCLAGPGEAGARAAELAATVVDDVGAPAAEVVAVRADDGYVDGEGRRVHPVLTLDPRAVSALWADYDAAEADVGQPSAIADVVARAAVHVWSAFTHGRDGCSGERNAAR